MKKLMVAVMLLIMSGLAIAGDWKYTEHEDEMRGIKKDLANLTSENAADFQSPYNGGSHLTVALIKAPSVDGRSVCGYQQCTITSLGISKGQFECMSMFEQITKQNVCYISVKFDDGPIEKYVVKNTFPDSIGLRHGSNIKFLEKITSASKLIIEANFYNEGTRQFRFDVKGLKWTEDSQSGVLSGYSQPKSVW